MRQRARRKFDAAFKTEAVKLCKAGGRSIVQIAKDLDVVERSLRDWIKEADKIAAQGSAAPAIAGGTPRTSRVTQASEATRD